jgi:signal transduction histidine kinase
MSYATLFEESIDWDTYQNEIAKRIQLLVLKGEGLDSIMRQIARDIEAAFPGFQCAIFVPSENKKNLVLVAAPSIPDKFKIALENIQIGPDSCPCGQTAFFGKPITLSDFKSAPNQGPIDPEIRAAGIRMIYSNPVKTEAEVVEAVFTLFASAEISVSDVQLKFLNHISLPILMAIYTSRAQKSLERERMAIEANRKLAALGEMASGISHEINGPLTVILGSAEMIKNLAAQSSDETELNRTALMKYSENINRNLARIQNIVRSLKSYSRNSTFDPPTATTIGALFDDVRELSYSRSHRAELNFNLANGSEDSILHCRPGEIVQVLLNLVNNALDAVKDSEDPWVTVDVYNRTDAIKITITDSGSGIPTEVERHLFDAFFTTKNIGEGTGLGLSISKKLISAHGGELYYNPRNKNTQFVVELPINFVEPN